MTIEQNKELIRRFDEVVARGDVAALDDLCAQDMVNHSLAPSRPKGLEGTRQFLQTGMPQLNEDGWTDSVMVAEGNYVVQFGVRGGNWRGGPFLGIDAAEPKIAQSEFIDKDVDHANGIVFKNPIFQAVSKQRPLPTINTFNKALHPIPANYSRIIPRESDEVTGFSHSQGHEPT